MAWRILTITSQVRPPVFTGLSPMPMVTVAGSALIPGLGFWIAPDRQGRGYATEAARAVLAMHFAGPAAEAVRSGYFADNLASAQVHRKLGFETLEVEQALCRALGQPRPLLRQRLSRDSFTIAS
jgi:RimJ/RimL family protein N-acetyltransferase